MANQRIRFPFVGAQEEGKSSTVNDQLTVNLYPNVEDGGAKAKIVLYPTPGLTSVATAGPGPFRGNGVVFDHTGSGTGEAYFVSGNTLIEVDQNNVVTEIGTLDTTTGPISMASGVSHLMVVDGTAGYTYDGASFAKITNVNFPTPDYVEWADNYFIVNSKGTGKFFISALNDPTSWAALDFATAESRPDLLLRPIWFRRDLLMIGEETSELYYNTGNADFPWSRYPNTLFEFGSPAPASAATSESTIFMLTRTRQGGFSVKKASSESATTISDKSLEYQISQMSTVTDAFGYCYTQEGHEFYVLTFPTGNRTFVYDNSNNMWHERMNGTGGRHIAGGHVFYNGTHLIGHYANSNLYKFETDVYTDDGSFIKRIRRAKILHENRHTLFHERLEIVSRPGVGLTSGQGSDPQVMLRWSDDGSRTWSNELWEGIGKIGEYDARTRWYQLGSALERTYEASMTDPVNWIIEDSYVDAEVGID